MCKIYRLDEIRPLTKREPTFSKLSPGILERGYFPYTFDSLRNSNISILYTYLAMFALWNELEFIKLMNQQNFLLDNKIINFETIRKLLRSESKIRDRFNPLFLKIIKKYKERVNFLKEKEIEVDADGRFVKIRSFKKGEGFSIPFTDDFSRISIKDEQFCTLYHLSRSSFRSAKKRLKELNLIDYGSSKTSYYKLTPPIKKWIEMPLKIFYLRDLSHSSKVILFWIKKYLDDFESTRTLELNRKNFMQFSGFKNEKTLRRLRRELILSFPELTDTLETFL